MAKRAWKERDIVRVGAGSPDIMGKLAIIVSVDGDEVSADEREALLHVDGMQATGWYALVKDLEAPGAAPSRPGRREHIATACMTAMLLQPNSGTHEMCAERAVNAADALLAALDAKGGAK